MEDVYIVKFRNDPRKVFCTFSEKLTVGDFVVVETSLGCEGGKIMEIVKKSEANTKELLTITRKISEKEREDLEMTDEEKSRYLDAFMALIRKHGLPMKAISADLCVEDKIVFTFSAESRIDFRDLVRELCGKVNKQVILKQIGSRDCARSMDGYGPCGRRLCCKQFLGTGEGVNMDMARLQGMSSKGAGKISGCCGRLMCCLKFENGCYKDAFDKLPKVGTKMKTEKGTGTIISVNPLKFNVEVELKDGSRVEVKL